MAITREDLMRAGIGTGGMNPNVIEVNEIPVGRLPAAVPAAVPVAPMPAQAAPQRQGLLGGFFGPQGRDARARLAIALEGMTMNPNQALIGQLQQDIENRETARQNNATVSWLRSRNRNDLADAVETGGLSAAEAMKIALEPAPTVDPQSAIAKLAADLRNNLITQEQFDIAVAGLAPQGMSIESDGQGGFRLIQGPGAATSGKPPTEGQLAGAGYLQRMTSAESILRDVERRSGVVSIPLEKTILMGTGAEGFVLNPTEQSIAQAQRDWVRAKLRKESGAVIGAEEMAAEIRTYFPQPGEGPEIVAQKAESRRRAERQMEIASGSAAEQAGEISPEYAAPIRADELARAGIGGGQASQPVVIKGVTIRKVN